MKIVILDGYTTNPGDLSWDFLNEFGTYTVYDRTRLVDRTDAVAGVDRTSGLRRDDGGMQCLSIGRLS